MTLKLCQYREPMTVCQSREPMTLYKSREPMTVYRSREPMTVYQSREPTPSPPCLSGSRVLCDIFRPCRRRQGPVSDASCVVNSALT